MQTKPSHLIQSAKIFSTRDDIKHAKKLVLKVKLFLKRKISEMIL